MADQRLKPASQSRTRHDSILSHQAPLQGLPEQPAGAVSAIPDLAQYATNAQSWHFDSTQFPTSRISPTHDFAAPQAYPDPASVATMDATASTHFPLGVGAYVQNPWDCRFDFENSVAQPQHLLDSLASSARLSELRHADPSIPMDQPLTDLDMFELMRPLEPEERVAADSVMLPFEFDPASAAAEIDAAAAVAVDNSSAGSLLFPPSTAAYNPDHFLTMPGALPMTSYLDSFSTGPTVFAEPASAKPAFDCQPQNTTQLRDSPTNSSLEVCSISGSEAGWATINMSRIPTTPAPLAVTAGPKLYSTPGADQTLTQTQTHMRNASHSSTGDRARRGSQLSEFGDALARSSVYADGQYQDQNQYQYHYRHPLPAGNHALDVSAPTNQQAIRPAIQRNVVYTPPSDDTSSSSSALSVNNVGPDAVPYGLAQSHEMTVGAEMAPKRRKTSTTSATAVPGGIPAFRVAKPARAADKTAAAQTTAVSVATSDRRVGRRNGPLRPDQREQARETRKVRACLRCKFLKKTCGRGNPCLSCQHSHARLWQVPCTRLDIKELHLFSNSFNCDYQKKVGSTKASRAEILGFGDQTYTLWITHGYDQLLPVSAREIFVRDRSMFFTTWLEADGREETDGGELKYTEHKVDNTPPLSVGVDGINPVILSQYLDNHIEGDFEGFIDMYMGGATRYIPDLLKTAHRYYKSTRAAMIRRALRFFTAYALTCHITFCEGLHDEQAADNARVGPGSRFAGSVLAPRLISFQVKYALSRVWREMHKEVLADLSSLYNSVYQGDKLRQWPHIFFLASILLCVWEMMQFDIHYREDMDEAGDAIKAKFCREMEAVPVGVVVGLFQTISTKLPSMAEWNSQQHAGVVNNDSHMADALTAISAIVNENDEYLRNRHTATYDRNDLDCLVNKLSAKLVIRVH